MPELPEVETVRRGLEKYLLGKVVVGVDVLLSKALIGQVDDLVGRTWLEFGRRGKLLMVGLSGDRSLLVHLRMTGQLLLKSKIGNRVLPDSHTRVVIEFEDGEGLYFQDQRTFGYLKITQMSDLRSESFLNSLGVEPLEDEFNSEYLRLNLKKKTRVPIKSFLLDQRIIAGIGNIYADEACFRAGIVPWRKCGELSEEERLKLFDAIKEVLALGVSLGGASAANYVDVSGGRGDFMGAAMVYRREGKACRVCGEVVVKKKFVGRGTHYCGVCQK